MNKGVYELDCSSSFLGLSYKIPHRNSVLVFLRGMDTLDYSTLIVL